MAKHGLLHVLGSRVWIGMVLILSAQAGWTFSIKPGAQVVRAKAGQAMDASFEVINDTNTPMVMSCQLRDSFVLPENKGVSVEKWLTPQFKDLTIPPNSSKKAVFKVLLPKKSAGELAALVSFVPQVPELPVSTATTGIQTRIVPMITVSLYARVIGTEKAMVDLGEVEVVNLPGNPGRAEYIQASVVVKNSGNIHLRPKGSFDIFTKQSDKLLYSLDFPSGWPVMPYSDNPYKGQAMGQLPPGDYRVRTHVVFTPSTALDKDTTFTVNALGQTTNYYELPGK